MTEKQEFQKWYDEYFCDTQGEDSPYSYGDVRKAFNIGWLKCKENLTKHNSRTIQSATLD